MFIDEVISKLQIKNSEFILPKITILGKNIVLIDGHKGITCFNKLEVGFKIKNGIVKIFGENLSINEVSTNEAIISGDIIRVEYV